MPPKPRTNLHEIPAITLLILLLLAPAAADDPYGTANTSRWYKNAFSWDNSPVDLSFLNRDERPAGRHGFVKAIGDHFVFEDGTPTRFWGGNLAASAIFSTPVKTSPPRRGEWPSLAIT